MTNSTIPTEAMGSPLPVSASFRWEAPNKPVSIQLSLDLVDRLEREVIDAFKAVTKRGSEVGGVLLGRIAQGAKRTVFVENLETVTCDYTRGPLYLLSDPDKERLRETVQRLKASPLAIVGFFRSNTRKDLVVDEEDLGLFQEFFPDSNNVFLLVKPFAMKPSSGGFFMWEEGRIQPESYLQFPFRRSELLKTLPGSIVQAAAGGGESAPAPAAREERAPVMFPKREERPPILQTVKREEPRPGPMIVPPRREEPPVVAKREEPPAAPKREEPPVFAKREETPVFAQREEALFKREEPPAVVKKEEPPVAAKPVEPPVARRETPPPSIPAERPTIPPVSFKREGRPPILTPPKREERAAPPPMAPKREERPPVAPLSFRREERPAQPPAPAAPPPAPVKPPEPPPAAKREERPVITPKREERPAPAPVAKREERPVPAPAKPAVTPVAPKQEEPPKREERPAVTPVAKREEPVAPPPAAKKEEPKEERAAATAAPAAGKAEVASAPPKPKPEPVRAAVPVREETVSAEPEPAKRGKLLLIAALAAIAIVGAGSYFFFFRKSPTEIVKVDENPFGLRVERSVGQLLLSWRKDAEIIANSRRATLSITDGDHKEDVELDQAQLRTGAITYAPITNDVSFRLVVIDLKTGRAISESLRALAGMAPAASSTTTANRGEKAAPANQTQAQAAPNAAPDSTKPTPDATAAPAPTEPLATRLRPPTPMQMERLASQSTQPVRTSMVEAPALDAGAASALPGGQMISQVRVAPAAPRPDAARPPTPTQPGNVQTLPPPATRAVTSGVREATVLRRVAPYYPDLAKRARVGGIVTVQATVGKDGKVRKAVATSGSPLLKAAAQDAVMRWTYEPAMLGGEAVESTSQVQVDFVLPR